jgi:hypothetical protein
MSVLDTLLDADTKAAAIAEAIGAEVGVDDEKIKMADALLVAGCTAMDNGQYPVIGAHGRPLITSRDFMQEIKTFIRFPVMDPKFIATVVGKTKLFDVDEEYRLVKAILRKDPLLARPYSYEKRKGAADFDSSLHFIRGRGSGSWNYNGAHDAIEVTASAACLLVGIGLMCSDHGSDASVRIIRGRNDGGHEERVVLDCPQQSFETTTRMSEPTPFLFEDPFEMEAGQMYTIDLAQQNRDRRQSQSVGSGGATMRSITMEGVTLTFSNASSSPNGTDTGSGAFPSFYICT